MHQDTYRLPEGRKFGLIPLLIGLAGLTAAGVGWAVSPQQFYPSWLMAFVFWVSLGLGGLFFTMLHHLVGATWSVVIRRISETLMAVLPMMVVFFIPVIFGIHTLYHWSHDDVVAQDVILQKKAAYLNEPFFIIRTLFYFVIWTIFAAILYRMSVRQDRGDMSVNPKMRSVSAPGMILYALTITYAAFDWLMSLDPHWYSTIFGAYYFSGCFLATVALMIVLVFYLQRKEVLKNAVTEEHYHDLGKWMFGFTIFWSYMAFSQFFLIWYANIPEETAFYLHRWEGSWKTVSLMLLFGRFVIPFFILLFRSVKRKPALLTGIAFFVLLMHALDIYWLVMPNFHPKGAQLTWIDAASFAAIGGIFMWYFWFRLRRHAVVPVGDPLLEKSIHIRN